MQPVVCGPAGFVEWYLSKIDNYIDNPLRHYNSVIYFVSQNEVREFYFMTQILVLSHIYTLLSWISSCTRLFLVIYETCTWERSQVKLPPKLLPGALKCHTHKWYVLNGISGWQKSTLKNGNVLLWKNLLLRLLTL